MVSSTPLVFALVCAHAVTVAGAGLGLRRRDNTSTPFVAQRLDIPLTFDSRGRVITSVTMSPGNGQQSFNFTMTTGTGLTYVASTQCSTCSGVALYNQTESSTVQSFGNANTVAFFGQNTAANVVKESCQLHQQNGSVWPYPNQTIIAISQQENSVLEQASNADVGSTLSGIIGLGSNRGSSTASGNSSDFAANFDDSIAGQYFIRTPQAENFTFGMLLNSPLAVPRGSNASGAAVSGAGSSAGVLHWLAPDPSVYDTSKVSWVTANVDSASIPTNPNNSTGSGDWFVGLDGWVMDSGNNHLSNTQSVVATVDPMYTDLYLPADQAKLIHDAIPGSALRTDLSSLGPLSQAYSIPCDSSFSFGIVAGSQTFTLDQDTLIISQPDGTCISGIEGWTDTTVTTYLFGSRFLSTIYLIFNVPKDGSNSVGFAPRSNSGGSSHVGAIVGGVIGGVAFVVLVAFAIFFFVYRHRHRAQRVTAAQYDHVEIEKPEEGGVHPYTLGSPTNAVQLTSGPESTAGSSGFSPVQPTFSPVSSSAAVGSVPGLGMDEHDASLDVAPPSYEEASEGSPRPSPTRPGFRNEKAAYRAATQQVSEGSRSQASLPFSSLPSPLRPVDENVPSASGSETLRD